MSPAASAYIANADLPHFLQDMTQTIRTAFLSPSTTQEHLSKDSHYQVVFDSGATLSISYKRDDFVGELKSPSVGMRLQGLASGLKIEGQGHVLWSFVDTTGILRSLKIPAYYVPQAKIRLLSTTSLLQTYAFETIHLDAHRLILSGNDEEPGEITNSVEILIDPQSNLPIGHAYQAMADHRIHEAFSAVVTTVAQSNYNLSPAEKELLR